MLKITGEQLTQALEQLKLMQEPYGPAAGDEALDRIFEILGDANAREFLNAFGIVQVPLDPGPPDGNSPLTGIAWSE